MLKLKMVLTRVNKTASDLSRYLGVSRATVCNIMAHGHWPKGATKRSDPALLRVAIEDYLAAHGATPAQVLTAFDEFEEIDEGRHWQRSSAASAPNFPGQQANSEQEEQLMLLRHQRLTHEARQHFKILRDPFVNEMAGADDVFISDDIRYVRAAVRQTVAHGGMLAVVGESGSGKSTIRKDLQEWVNNSGEQITIIEPYVVGMSASSKAGRPLLAADIVGAVIRNLAPSASMRMTQERRTDQMHQLLRESAKVGNKHVLIIEEAHDLATPTLRSMKRFYEIEDGFKKLLSIILIGQTELARKLSEKNPEVREVVQRCELVTLPPLNNSVGAYLEHKFSRVGAKLDTVMTPDAIDAIRAVLRRDVTETLGGKRVTNEQSLCYPLAVNNLLTRAMNNALAIGAPKVNAGLIQAAIKGDSDA